MSSLGNVYMLLKERGQKLLRTPSESGSWYFYCIYFFINRLLFCQNLHHLVEIQLVDTECALLLNNLAIKVVSFLFKVHAHRTVVKSSGAGRSFRLCHSRWWACHAMGSAFKVCVGAHKRCPWRIYVCVFIFFCLCVCLCHWSWERLKGGVTESQ